MRPWSWWVALYGLILCASSGIIQFAVGRHLVTWPVVAVLALVVPICVKIGITAARRQSSDRRPQ